MLGKVAYKKAMELEQTKANKQQGDWISPTLLNGWVRVASNRPPARYFKDNFGVVHLEGHVAEGNGVIFLLPEGYRPQYTHHNYVVPDSFGTGQVATVNIRSTGEVEVVYATLNRVALNGITFRAVN